MPGNIIDGERWIADRLRFLRARLAEELAEDERAQVESEIALLSKERGVRADGRRPSRLLRRLRRR
ncbi:MAG TPA: hypothetical protein VM142_13275 [Acidimicrobiales bacterium]|nr:hypothetical protein [Acidimicrobiales bacterium]